METYGKKLKTIYRVECIAPDGKVRWVEEVPNLVTTVGLNDSLDKHFKASGYTAAWYVGLVSSSPTFALADTMASHSGWTEFTDYDEAARQVLTLGTPASGSVDNSASKATFVMGSAATIGGAFIVNLPTKGQTSGTVYGGSAFSGGNRPVNDGDTVSVTATLSASN